MAAMARAQHSYSRKPFLNFGLTLLFIPPRLQRLKRELKQVAGFTVQALEDILYSRQFMQLLMSLEGTLVRKERLPVKIF